MKKNICAILLFVAVLLFALPSAASITLLLEPGFSGAQGARGSTIVDFLHVELSNHSDLRVVDRQTLRRVLDEHSLSQQALGDTSQTQRLGGLLGASYFVRAWMLSDGGQSYLMLRVVQVETTMVSTRAIKVDADASAIEMAQALADELPTVLKSMDEAVEPIPPLPEMPEIPADLKRPTVMVVIPEFHIAPSNIEDPAGETEIISLLIDAGFNVVDAGAFSGVSQSPSANLGDSRLARHAISRGAQILLYGEAISERATALGEFVGCRARIELKAIETGTEKIIAIDREVSGATDTSEAVAAKRAIEQAARHLGVRLIPQLVDQD